MPKRVGRIGMGPKEGADEEERKGNEKAGGRGMHGGRETDHRSGAETQETLWP